MFLLVNISEKDWKFLRKNYKVTGLGFVPNPIKNECVKAVFDGTPLPKGYGVIVDIAPLMRGLYEEMRTGGETYTTSEVYKMLEEECQVIIKTVEEGGV